MGGQGYKVSQEFKRPGWYSVLGLAWSFPMEGGNTAWRVKPSVQYSGESIRAVGGFTFVTEPAPDSFLVHRADAEEKQTRHWIGPGLEIEFVFINRGPIRTSFFAGFHTMFLLSDDRIEFSDPTVPSSFSVTEEDVRYRGAGGFRVAWIGSIGAP